MPVFEFQHQESGEIISVLVTLKESDEARHQQIQNGKVYKRIYSAPLAAHDITKGTLSKEDFKRTTEGKNVKVGDLWKISEEMSKDRADKNGGFDPVKEDFYKKYQRENSKPHPDVAKRERLAASKEMFKEMGIRVE